MELSTELKAYNFETMRHIERVRNLGNWFVIELLRRGELHDQCKLESPEVEAFAAAKPLKGITFGSPEYEENKRVLAGALSHHYARSRHHPEHHKCGVDDMNLIDIVEMFLDWKAGSERHNDGNILMSIESNSDTHRLSPQLRRIFENTAKVLPS